ncbi:MAG: restriction endonuclease [Candidatus Bathyarchaeia archaeon]
MVNFCPDCGEKLPLPNPRFCPNCGRQLAARGETERPEEERNVSASVQDLGKKLEECVEKILVGKGYVTERRKRIEGPRGIHEIDIVAKRGNVTRAVECKNWKDPVGIEQIRNFWAKLQDIGSNWNGLFVSLEGFTEDAEGFAEACNIDRWDKDFLKEEWLAVGVGRATYAARGETRTVKNALPLNVNFSQASETILKNEEKTSVSGMLSYHPYFVASYAYYAKFKDPTKETHTFKDEGKVFIDALDGAVLNPSPTKLAGTVKRTLKLLVSKEAREESKRNKRLVEELSRDSSLREYEVTGGDKFKVRILEPVASSSSATKSTIEFVTAKNTETIRYRAMTKGKEPTIRTVTYAPKRQNINIKSITLVNVPRWDIDFEAFNKTYSREMLACSGTVLEDTLRNCPKHTGPFKKENIAVCEKCGQALCDKHVFACPTCGKWLCEEHGAACKSCHLVFCREHIPFTCALCNQPVCSGCRVACPICGREYGRDHTVSCSQCGKAVCTECVTVTGLIKKKRVCRECQR